MLDHRSIVAIVARLHTVSEMSIRRARPPTSAPRWGSFALVCVAYLVATTGEQMLSPLYPDGVERLRPRPWARRHRVRPAAGSIAVINLVGGLCCCAAIGRAPLIRSPLASSAWSAVVAATATAIRSSPVAGQVLLGAGAGLFFPAGLQACRRCRAGPAKGFAMGIYGVAFSGRADAGRRARCPRSQSRAGGSRSGSPPGSVPSLSIGGGRCGHGPSRYGAAVRRFSWRTVIGLPTAVGTVAAVLPVRGDPVPHDVRRRRVGTLGGQRGDGAGRRPRRCRSLAKVVGGASTDRVGAKTSARRPALVLTATGIAWVLLPGRLIRRTRRRRLRRHGQLARAGRQHGRGRTTSAATGWRSGLPVGPDRHRRSPASTLIGLARRRRRPAADRWLLPSLTPLSLLWILPYATAEHDAGRRIEQ